MATYYHCIKLTVSAMELYIKSYSEPNQAFGLALQIFYLREFLDKFPTVDSFLDVYKDQKDIENDTMGFVKFSIENCLIQTSSCSSIYSEEMFFKHLYESFIDVADPQIKGTFLDLYQRLRTLYRTVYKLLKTKNRILGFEEDIAEGIVFPHVVN